VATGILRSQLFFEAITTLNRKDEILRQSLKAISDVVGKLRDVGLDELPVDLRLAMSKFAAK
jgi:hypothetical protein